MNEQATTVYRGSPDRIHIADGHRGDMGEYLAEQLDRQMRNDAVDGEMRTWDQAFGERAQKLCPGCYMTVLYDMAVALAQRNGQSLQELGKTMALVFTTLAETGGPARREEVPVQDEPAHDEPTPEPDLPYLDGFEPNDGYDPPEIGYEPPRFGELGSPYVELPYTERDLVWGLSSYGMDAGLVR